MAISSGAAYSAVDRLVREVLQAYNPHPALEQVRAVTRAHVCLSPALPKRYDRIMCSYILGCSQS